jgi:hypothetical protein
MNTNPQTLFAKEKPRLPGVTLAPGLMTATVTGLCGEVAVTRLKCGVGIH